MINTGLLRMLQSPRQGAICGILFWVGSGQKNPQGIIPVAMTTMQGNAAEFQELVSSLVLLSDNASRFHRILQGKFTKFGTQCASRTVQPHPFLHTMRVITWHISISERVYYHYSKIGTAIGATHLSLVASC
jgi:hypothetical protein